MNNETAENILKEWRRGGCGEYVDQSQLGLAIDFAVQTLAKHDTAMSVLKQIAERKRRTQEQRLASSCVVFLDALN